MQQFLKLNLKKELSWVNWKKEEIAQLPKNLIATKKAFLETIKKIPQEKRTFENTVGALERADEDISDAFCRLEVLLNTHTDKDVRDVCAETITKLSSLTTDMVYDEDIYRAVAEYKAKGSLPKKDSDKKVLKETLDAYRRLGFELPKDKRAQVQKLFKDLQTTTQMFDRNINEWRGSILVSKEELAGTPTPYQESLERKDGKYVVSTDYPSMNPFLTFSQSEPRRKELWTLVQEKGGKENLVVLKKLLNLRKQIATLLGYKSWAHYQLEQYLVKTPDKARKTIMQVLQSTKKAKDKDFKELEALKKLDSKNKLQPWDIAYYDNLLRQKKYRVDENELREHFPLTHVISTMFSIFENLLGISFTKAKGMPAWHEDVFRYELRDTKSKEIIGYMFLDLYPRPGKYGHACATQTSEPRKDEKTGLQKPPVVTLMCNFAKPGKGTISLLSRYDVETMFHEFGHALHFLLSKAEYMSQSAFKTKMDFVEAPSQLLEHWCWNPRILGKITKHYKTGLPLSKAKITALAASENHMEGYGKTRQMVQSLLSLDIHEQNIPDVRAHFRLLAKKYLGFEYPSQSLFPAGFGHLGGYAAGYYVYIYSKIYCDDLASVFKAKGMENKMVGARYRKEILEQGALRDEDVSAQAFLGRKVNTKAFIKEMKS
jgi:thimet oligopeptidase